MVASEYLHMVTNAEGHSFVKILAVLQPADLSVIVDLLEA